MANEPALYARMEMRVKDAEKQLAKFAKRLDSEASGMEKRWTRASKNMDTAMSSGFGKMQGYAAKFGKGLAAPLAGIGAALSVNALVKYADQWSDLQARVGNAAGSMEAAPLVMERISEMARRTYSDLGQTAEAYIANAGTLRELGYSTQQTLDYTEALNNALVVSGAKGDVAASVMNALSKAMALGKLSGDNLNTVMASGGRVADALAASMGKSTLELRKLGGEGKITRKEMFGITKELDKLRREAEGMPATVADAYGQLNNAVLQWVGGMDQASGASVKVAEHILSLADNFGQAADVALTLATVLGTALAGKAMAGLVAGAVSGAQSVGYLVTALRAGTVSAAAFNAALGPIGLTIGVVAAGVMLLRNNQSEASKAAERFETVIDLNASALDKAKDASGRYSQALRDQIAMQLEAAKAAAAMADATFWAAQGRVDAFQKMTGMKFAPFEYAADQARAEADALTGSVLKIEQQLEKLDKVGVSKPVVPSDAPDKKGKKAKTERDDEYGRLTKQITDRTAALVAETEAQRQVNPLIDDYGFAVEKARAEQELLNAAQKAGIELTPELRKEISATANQFALATVEANQLAEAQGKIREKAEEAAEFQKDLSRGIVDGFIQGRKAADVFADALGRIGQKLLDLAFDGLFDIKGGGGFGGIFASIGKALGFDKGGYTGPGGVKQPAGIVHKGEVVWSQADVRKAGGVGVVEAMRRGIAGYDKGGAPGYRMAAMPTGGTIHTARSLKI